jgi:magnesium chelatase subunit D
VSAQWLDALVAAACMAVAPQALKGIQVRSCAGPLRDYWLSYYEQLARSPLQKIPCTVEDERLLGGVDIAASLTLGKPVNQVGLLASMQGQTLVLAMAERLSQHSATLIAQAVDGTDLAVIAFDESANEDEALAKCLDERLPIVLTLGGMSLLEFQAMELAATAEENDLPIGSVDEARRKYKDVVCDETIITALCSACIALGVDSMRAPIAALSIAKIHAALNDRTEVDEDDVSFAVRVVISPRATMLPNDQQADEQTPEQPEDNSEQEPQDEKDRDEPPTQPEDQNSADEQTEPTTEQIAELQELILQAAIASIPSDLLASLQNSNKATKAKSAGNSGAAQRGGKRGRSAGVFRKKPDSQARIHLLHTLRASIPWQKMRWEQSKSGAQTSQVSASKIQIRKDDFRYQKIEQKSKSTIVFAIDASGSSALNRLAEAKGAIELLLAQCYVRRDQVAVIAFRGNTAAIILPPTRSLARAKRSLAGVPGGGGTPLASALDCVTVLSKSIQKKGETPFVVLLTDGRANVSLTGSGGRAQAQDDAKKSAKEFCSCNIAAIVLDTSPQPHYLAQGIARDMGANYMPLPFAGAQAISEVVQKSYRRAG